MRNLNQGLNLGKIGNNFHFLVDTQIKLIFQIHLSIHLFNFFCWLTLMTQIGI